MSGNDERVVSRVTQQPGHAGAVSSTVPGARPLADVRILAVEQFGAGPWATLQLADLGADVIKIEDPHAGGDVSRYVPPFQAEQDSLFFESFNRNKRSVALDLKNPQGQEVFHHLVAASDAVFSNLRGDQPVRLGLTYDALATRNPRIVCCSLSGFGMTGPRAAEGGYDYVVQGLAGWMSLTGEPDAPPAKTGLSLVDLSAGYAAAVALLGGLWRARRDGVGCDCDISLFETALAELAYVGTWAATEGYAPRRQPDSAHPSLVPFQNFETADGWIVVACPKPKFWIALCDAIERPDLGIDARFADFGGRDANREDLLAILRETFSRRRTGDWLQTLGAFGVPSAPINDVAHALEDPQAIERGAIVSVDHPRFGTVREVASPLRLSGPPAPLVRAPTLGEHTREVLREVCGYARPEIDRYAALGAFGPEPLGRVDLTQITPR